MNALEIKNLTKAYPGFKLDDLSLTLPSGCIMGLVGENGAGKSTTIKLILDMIRKDSGSITILGKENEKHIELIKEDVGVVMDEVGIPECLTARQVGKVMKHTFQNWDEAQYASLLQKLSLPESKAFKELSRGMKMKLGIAIALSHKAKLLILDEATSSVDTETEQIIQDTIEHVMKGRTSFVVAHRLSTIVNADKILVIKNGVVTEQGTHDELMELKGYYYRLYTNQFNEKLEAEILGVREEKQEEELPDYESED